MRTYRTIRIVLGLAVVGTVLALASESRAGDFRIRFRIGSSATCGRAPIRHVGGRYFRSRRFVRRPILVTRPLRRVIVIRNTASHSRQSVVYVTRPVSRHSAVVYTAPSRRSSCRTVATTTHRRR